VIKKALVTVITAGALSVPLAGVAWADDPPADPGPNGVGAGGIPRVIGDNFETDPIPPGTGTNDIAGINDFTQQPGLSVPDAISAEFPDTDRTPGGAIKRLSPGCGNGDGPKDTDFSICE
jgi:hypothetical protein